MLRRVSRSSMIKFVHNLIIVIIAACCLVPKCHDIDDLLWVLFLLRWPNTTVGQ